MSEAERDHMESIIDDRMQVLLSALFWRLIRWIGIPGFIGVVAVAGGWATLTGHLKDGHPGKMNESLIRIETRQESIKEDVSEVKKKLELRHP